MHPYPDTLLQDLELFDHAPYAMCVTGRERKFLQVNEALCRMLGYTAAELLGMSWTTLTHPDDLATSLERAEQLRRDPGACIEVEKRYIHRNGNVLWVRIKLTALPDLLGNSTRYLLHIEDITDHKSAKEALQESEDRFRVIADSCPEKVWGRSRSSLYDNPLSWAEAIHPQDSQPAHALFARQLQGERVDSEYRIRTPEGNEKWIRDRAFAVRDEAGELIRVVGVADEISESKRYEAALIRAREGADAANRAKSRFLATMSHEIRTPMNGVVGMIQLLLETELTSEQRRFASVAQESGRTLLTLIDEILDLSKIEARKMVLEKLTFNLRTAVEDVVQLMQVQANAKGITISAQTAPDVPTLLRGDVNRFRQVLTNLAANAIKFTEHGNVSIGVVLELVSGPVTTIRFTVTDTGIGMRPDQIETLFSPFTQGDVSTTRRYGGTGLGLAICKQLVEMMNGTIGVDSIDGGGSSFWFTLAFESAPAGPLSIPRQQNPGQRRVVTVDGRPARILVAEDNAINRDVALAQLKNLGYEASTVTNGAEAIVALQGGDYDLVLMDCEMPVMDGFEATTHIRRSDRANIPIIAVTAGAMPSDRDRCFSEGMNDYLAKPVDLGQLAEALFRNLSGRTERNTASDAAQTLEIAAAQEKDSVFDVDGLFGRLMGDTQLAGVILRSFVRDIPCQIDKLRERLVERDRAGIRLQVHTLKGAAGTAAATRLYKVAIEMERASADTLVDHCLELMPRAVEEFQLFKNAVAQTEWIQTAAESDFQRNTERL